jgi:hypothetical protein
MRNAFAWLGIAALAVIASPDRAHAGDPLKPYVVLVFDTSGSMDDGGSATGFGPPSCGGNDTRLDHARCAVSKIVNSYGDMVFALTRFRTTMTNSITAGQQFPSGCGVAGAGTAGALPGTCTHLDDALEVLTPLVDGNNDEANKWVNFSGNTCQTGRCSVTTATSCDADGDCPAGQTCNFAAGDPEIWNGTGNTPLAGSLAGVKQYYSGVATSTNGSTIWPSNLAGFAPIANDPTKLAFIPPLGSTQCNPSATCTVDPPNCAALGTCCCVEQCRPYLVILLTDGDETCSQRCSNNVNQLCLQDSDCGAGTCDVNFSPGVANATSALLSTTVEGRRYRIETKPIGFGKPNPDAEIEAIAHAGGEANVTTPIDLNEGFYAQNEEELQLAISSILDDAIKTEICNDRDDDCDGDVDEDFEPDKGNACSNGAQGLCRRDGNLVCKGDFTGLTCNAEQRTCVNNQLFINGAPQGANTCGEICNSLDDDCDGKVDENLVGCSCSPQQEQCNGRDDDCDTRIDEASNNGPPITRPCGTGTCQGVETCRFVQNCGALPGAPGCSGFGGCTAALPTTEDCDGIDNNCDGIRDGFQQGCSTMDSLPPNNDPFDSPTNNPGHPDNDPIPENICTPGFKVCPANPVTPGNAFGACSGEVKPCNNPSNDTPDSCADLCNGLDDDCDNLIDEDFASANCDTDCGVGSTACVDGQLECNAVQASDDDSCDGVDDDCDLKFDEDFACSDPTPKPGFPATCDPKPATCDPSPTCTSNNCCCACACTGSGVCNGTESCINGNVTCQGEPISQESCDCLDNDCDGDKDEGNLCGSGSICNQFCQCAFQCSAGEFPCPLGKFCKTETAGCSTAATCDSSDACTQDPDRTDCCCRSLCISDPCFGIACPAVDGNKQVCQVNAEGNQGTCVDACSVSNCAPLICIPETGECKPDDCTTFPDRCSENQNCINGTCVTNLCKDVDCPTDQYCVGGNCVASCADVECPSGQRCKLGVCEDDPCNAPCPFGQACNDNTGECVANGCPSLNCPQGQWCNPNNDGGTCEDDPCVGTACPNDDEVCLGGTCYDPDDFAPDGGVEVRVTAGGGGCDTGGGNGWLLLGLALLFLRRKGGRS